MQEAHGQVEALQLYEYSHLQPRYTRHMPAIDMSWSVAQIIELKVESGLGGQLGGGGGGI